MPITRNNIRLKHQLFTANGTWVVPAGVNVIWIDGCGGGGGGGGGYPSSTQGGGGGGGTSGQLALMVPVPVVPGESLAVTIGAGGAGGNAGLQGGNTTSTSVIGSLAWFNTTHTLGGYSPNTNALGGHVAGYGNIIAYGGTGAGSHGQPQKIDADSVYVGRYAGESLFSYVPGSSGGGPGYAGGPSFFISIYNTSGGYVGGGTPSGNQGSGLGGGGSGASTFWGTGGAGGNAGQAGGNATGYGAGGGGGGANAAGGAGAPGFVRIYWEG